MYLNSHVRPALAKMKPDITTGSQAEGNPEHIPGNTCRAIMAALEVLFPPVGSGSIGRIAREQRYQRGSWLAAFPFLQFVAR
jgi:hypothetical protein